MNCNMDENLLYAYEDGTIDPLEKIFVEEHIKYCEKCRKKIRMIKSIDEDLKMCQDDFDFPERLSVISEMTAENCISDIQDKDSKVKVRNYIGDMKRIGNVIIKSQFIKDENPYNKAINGWIKKAAINAAKPVKKYIEKKIDKYNIFKMLKAG